MVKQGDDTRQPTNSALRWKAAGRFASYTRQLPEPLALRFLDRY